MGPVLPSGVLHTEVQVLEQEVAVIHTTEVQAQEAINPIEAPRLVGVVTVHPEAVEVAEEAIEARVVVLEVPAAIEVQEAHRDLPEDHPAEVEVADDETNPKISNNLL